MTTLIAAFALTMGAAIGTAVPSVGALAVDYTPSGIFSAGRNGAVTATAAEDGEDSFVQFELSDGGSVHYRRDLALEWFEKVEEVVTQKYFSVEFALDEINFETLTLSFESAQENVSKDGTTENALLFTVEEGQVYAACKYADEDAGSKTAIDVSSGVKVAFVSDENGTFQVNVNDTAVGAFQNIGGYYMEYLSSSSSTPRIPMSFEADLAEGETTQLIAMKSLNGQSLKLTDGKIVDNAPAALVVNEKVNHFPLGYKFALSYEAIDVCDESVSVSRQYYMYEAPEAGAEEADPSYSTLSTSTYFLPQTEGSTQEEVSVRFKLDDGRVMDADEYVYLSWYVDSARLGTHGETQYIPVSRDDQGPSYTCTTIDADENTVLDDAAPALVAYESAVKEASEKLNAGEGSYFYLPSLRGLITDNFTDYNNLKFTVYYKTQFSASTKTASSLNYNALRFEIEDEAEYSFRVIASDKLGNGMTVMEDGKPVSVTASNVWELDCIPQFTFTARSTGATIEDPGEQSLGYRDSVYSASDFEIVGIEGYEVEYTLFYFDQNRYNEEKGSMPTYSDMVEAPTDYVAYLEEIRAYDDSVTQDDAAWDRTDNDYEWNATELTFRPQQSGYYFIRADVTDKVYPSQEVIAYQVIEVRNPIDEIAGEVDWLQNNVAAIVLFSISAVLAIAIVVLFVVKPSDKKMEEVNLTELKGQKKNK